MPSAAEDGPLDDAAVDAARFANVEGGVLEVEGDDALANAGEARADGGLEIFEVAAELEAIQAGCAPGAEGRAGGSARAVRGRPR